MKIYFTDEKKPTCIEILLHSLKHINIFLILYTKWARKFVYVLQCATNQKKFENYCSRGINVFWDPYNITL
jgi:hypothetical protein